MQLHDYLGEPDKWPQVSSTFGAFDVGGLPKPSSFWFESNLVTKRKPDINIYLQSYGRRYRSWWLSAIEPTDAGRPPLPGATTNTTVYLVEAWEPQLGGKTTRSLHAYSNAPYVRLLVNGAAYGPDQRMPSFGSVNWPAVPYAAGNATALALSGPGGTVLAAFTRTSVGNATALQLSLDAPNPATGTGRAVYLDGTDVAVVSGTYTA